MKIRINSTGRKKIGRDKISITVHPGNPRTLDAEFRLEEYQFRKKAKVVLDAMCAGSEVVQRFDFGTVDNISQPLNNQLNEIAGENIFFTLKIIDRNDEAGLILGIAENLHSGKDESETPSKGILPIEPSAELGNVLWQLEEKGDAIHLLVNKDVPSAAENFRSNPLFAALVYPAIIRDILFRVIKHNDNDEDVPQWAIHWKRFAKQFQLDTMPDDEEGAEAWIENVVDGFCRQFSLKEAVIKRLEIL